MNAEQTRLEQSHDEKAPWKKWGPYLSERQWGTVRADYSPNGDADPHWRDHILFYEYFHGDNGAGLGASHQTGWTGVVAKLIQLFGRLDAKTLLEAGKRAFIRGQSEGEAKP